MTKGTTIVMTHPSGSRIIMTPTGLSFENVQLSLEDNSQELLLKPNNYLSPEWPDENKKLVHDWRAYISADLRQMWDGFCATQKRALAENAQTIADGEEWD